jgi:hypothetical protein
LVIAILATALAAAGNAAVALINGSAQRKLEETRATAARELETSKTAAQFELERTKAEAGRILEVIKTGQEQSSAI